MTLKLFLILSSFFSILICDTSYAMTWRDLWLRPDQQAAAALQAGKPEIAAALFSSPAWKGVAQYRAGQYAAAYIAFDNDASATGFYNRGNALALQGQYAAAIKAYDEAIKQQPNFEDAIYNKALLEEKNNTEQHQQDKKQQQEQQEEKKTENNSAQQNNTSDKNQQSSAGDNQDQQDESSQNDASKNSTNKKPASGEPQQPDKSENSASDKNSNTNPSTKEPALPKAGLGQKTAAEQQNAMQQQATQEWLQAIPDDPGGLLKQKFLRDHQNYLEKRQQGLAPW